MDKLILLIRKNSVSSFAAGHFSIKLEEKPCPSLVYATFHNKIYVYYNVSLPRITLNTVTDILAANPVFHNEENKKYFAHPSQLREVVSKTLYRV